MAKQPIIQIADLRKVYETGAARVYALNGVDLEKIGRAHV